jgi:hypothetical protein
VGDLLSGKKCWVDGGVVTGNAPAGSDVDGANGSLSMTILDGLYSGSKTCTATDSDLVSGNIRSGVDVFGVVGAPNVVDTTSGDAAAADVLVGKTCWVDGGEVTGTAYPAQPLKTGQTTSYGTGSDGDLEKGQPPGVGMPRSFTDNGDGTITDNNTGLMWEKKDDSGGIHDKDDTYTWGMTSSPYTMNGTMVSTFLATLNASGGFAGYTDWRVPNINELQGIVNYQVFDPSAYDAFHNAAGCAGCTDVTAETCSCTRSSGYWSSTTGRYHESYAWYVYFRDGTVYGDSKSYGGSVRAVRGGLPGLTCNGIPATDPAVCSSHGTCVSQDTCVCSPGWSGIWCQNAT